MRIFLDCSPRKIAEYTQRYGHAFGQLRTPLTNYAQAPGITWAADNGFYTNPDAAAWIRWVARFEDQVDDRPAWVAMPDIVGDAQRTLELFEYFGRRTNGLPRALVLQDGIGRVPIPWDQVTAVFIGGSDDFKVSREAYAAAKTARILGKQIHVGRINTFARCQNWLGLADTLDGSGISRYDHMLEDVLSKINGEHPQGAMAL